MAHSLNLLQKQNRLTNCVIDRDSFGYAHTKTGIHEKFIHNDNVVLGIL
ncbi:hypothetical protein [Campylobacter concisus]|nr:hypothetical protein [Campylobacter concisus]